MLYDGYRYIDTCYGILHTHGVWTCLNKNKLANNRSLMRQKHRLILVATETDGMRVQDLSIDWMK